MGIARHSDRAARDPVTRLTMAMVRDKPEALFFLAIATDDAEMVVRMLDAHPHFSTAAFDVSDIQCTRRAGRCATTLVVTTLPMSEVSASYVRPVLWIPPRMSDGSNPTALALAARACAYNVVRVLLQRGVRPVPSTGAVLTYMLPNALATTAWAAPYCAARPDGPMGPPPEWRLSAVAAAAACTSREANVLGIVQALLRAKPHDESLIKYPKLDGEEDGCYDMCISIRGKACIACANPVWRRYDNPLTVLREAVQWHLGGTHNCLVTDDRGDLLPDPRATLYEDAVNGLLQRARQIADMLLDGGYSAREPARSLAAATSLCARPHSDRTECALALQVARTTMTDPIDRAVARTFAKLYHAWMITADVIEESEA